MTLEPSAPGLLLVVFSDLGSCDLSAATLQIQARDTGSEQHHCSRFRNGVGGGEFKLDAVVPEVTIGIESKGHVVAVQEIRVKYLQLVGSEIVNERGWSCCKAL